MPLTKEEVEAFLTTPDGLTLLQPKLDSAISKGISTWKDKTLPTVIETEITKRFPGETPEQKENRQLKEELAKERRKTFAVGKVPPEYIDFVTGTTPEEIQASVTKLAATHEAAVKKAVDEKFKTNGFNPVSNNVDLTTIDGKIAASKNVDDTIALKIQKGLGQNPIGGK